MTTEIEDLRNDLLALPIDVRASLARALIESLEGGTNQEDADQLWIEEIQRRDEEIRSGRANLKPADQCLREARELLRCLK